MGLVLLGSLSSGCVRPLELCSLLSVEEAREFDSSIIASATGLRDPISPKDYCIFTNSDGEELLLFTIGNATKNAPFEILQTYTAYMEGDNAVHRVDGIGNAAAALFSDDYDEDKFRILFANNDKWSITVRASGITSENSARFDALRRVSNRTLYRF